MLWPLPWKQGRGGAGCPLAVTKRTAPRLERGLGGALAQDSGEATLLPPPSLANRRRSHCAHAQKSIVPSVAAVGESRARTQRKSGRQSGEGAPTVCDSSHFSERNRALLSCERPLAMSIRWRRPRPFSLAESHGKRSPKGGGGRTCRAGAWLARAGSPWQRGGAVGGAPPQRRLSGAGAAAEVSAEWAWRAAALCIPGGRGGAALPAFRSARLPPDAPRAPHLPPRTGPFLPPGTVFPLLRQDLFLPLPFGGRSPGGVRPGLAGLTGPPGGLSSSQTLLTAGTQSAEDPTHLVALLCCDCHTLASGDASRSQSPGVSERGVLESTQPLARPVMQTSLLLLAGPAGGPLPSACPHVPEIWRSWGHTLRHSPARPCVLLRPLPTVTAPPHPVPGRLPLLLLLPVTLLSF